jgi:hypothetical protein
MNKKKTMTSQNSSSSSLGAQKTKKKEKKRKKKRQMLFHCCFLELMNKISKNDEEYGARHLGSLSWSFVINGENTRK